MPFAFSIFLALLEVAFFICLLVYIQRLPQIKVAGRPDIKDVGFSASQGFKALKVVSVNHKTADEVASAMEVSLEVAEAILKHLKKSDLVQCTTLNGVTAWSITDEGKKSLPQDEGTVAQSTALPAEAPPA